jgi:hypothetical protein
MKNPLEDITAVTVNWLTARRTLGAIWSFKKFYPNIPLLVVDDDSNPKDKNKALRWYQKSGGPYDPDTNKIKEEALKIGFDFIQVPPNDFHPTGHGNAMDYAARYIKTRWMFHFHPDYRLIKLGILEELTADLNEDICGVGADKTRHSDIKALASVAAIYNVELGKKHNISFKPIVYYKDGHTTPFPGRVYEGGKALEAAGYYIGRLVQLGYKVKILDVRNKYGVHLRLTEERKEEWNKYF